jgi:hypothetical protein
MLEIEEAMRGMQRPQARPATGARSRTGSPSAATTQQQCRTYNNSFWQAEERCSPEVSCCKRLSRLGSNSFIWCSLLVGKFPFKLINVKPFHAKVWAVHQLHGHAYAPQESAGSKPLAATDMAEKRRKQAVKALFQDSSKSGILYACLAFSSVLYCAVM